MLVACPDGCGRSAPCIKNGCFPLLLSLLGETRVREQAAEFLFPQPARYRLPDAAREDGSMPELEETIFAPEPVGGQWLQGGPVSLNALRGKGVALIDFWDYTCVNCIRTLPYVVQWHRRYAADGLTVIGVHAPEFNFARQSEFVLQAVADFHLEYPVVLDNSYVIWRAYSNRFWPARYLVDAAGRIRY